MRVKEGCELDIQFPSDGQIDLSVYQQRILELSKMPLELLRHLALRIRHNRADERVIIVQEPVSLPSLRNTLTLLDKECLVFFSQPAETAANGLVVSSFAAQRQNALQEVGKSLRERMGSGAL